MNEEQINKLAKESAILCLRHKYRVTKDELLELLQTKQTAMVEFQATREKYYELIKTIEKE